MNPIQKFWIFVTENINHLNKTDGVIAEFMEFANKYKLQGPEITKHPDFVNLSEPTQKFLQAYDYLKEIDKRLTMYISPYYIRLPTALEQVVVKNHIAEIEREYGAYPDVKIPVPIIVRYDLILTTGCSFLAGLVDDVYNTYKIMINKKIIKMSDEWLVTKYLPAYPKVPPFIFKGVEITDQLQFILQPYKPNAPPGKLNHIEFIVKINKLDEFEIHNQEDVDDFKQCLLRHIDKIIGEYKAFIYITNVTIVPNELWLMVSKDFPPHYILQEWSEIANALEIIPKADKCSMCLLTRDNSEIKSVLTDDNPLIPQGNYCNFCFKLIANVISCE